MKVFISSLIRDMEPIRAAAREAVASLGHEAIMAEDFPAQPQSPQVACLVEVIAVTTDGSTKFEVRDGGAIIKAYSSKERAVENAAKLDAVKAAERADAASDAGAKPPGDNLQAPVEDTTTTLPRP